MSQKFIVAGPIAGLYHVLYKVPGTIVHSSVSCSPSEDLANEEAGRLNSQPITDAKKRWHARGEKAGNAKPKDADVLEIKALISQGATFAGIAKRYGVSSMCISRINSGKTWGHLNG